MLVDLVIVRPDEFSGSETSALSENPARNFINIISEIDIGTSVCVCVCVKEKLENWRSRRFMKVAFSLNETSRGGDRRRRKMRKMRTIN